MRYIKKFFYRIDKNKFIPHPPYFWMSISWLLFIMSIIVKLIWSDKQVDTMIGILAGLCGGVTVWYRKITNNIGGGSK